MRILRARLLAAAEEEAAPRPATPAAQVRTVDRSERIRTYNFPENRIADHRTGYKAYNLDQVLDGDLEPCRSPRRGRRGRAARRRRRSDTLSRPLLRVGAAAAGRRGCRSPAYDARRC